MTFEFEERTLEFYKIRYENALGALAIHPDAEVDEWFLANEIARLRQENRDWFHKYGKFSSDQQKEIDFLKAENQKWFDWASDILLKLRK